MLLSLPPELAVAVSQAPSSSSYMGSRIDRQLPIFSPNVSSYTEHLFHARRPSKQISSVTGMPRPNPPPTPGSSSDLRGKEGGQTAPSFHLPPTAFQEPDRTSTSSATPSANGSDSSYRPVSPTSPADLSMKRPATQHGTVITKDDFALPPPPTRSRKIIQMKPHSSEGIEQHSPGSGASQPAKGQGSNQTGGKRKQNNVGATAAGRKIARKTAHSLIERRRRSKMNEEFGVLKDMIPACKGQEMHKLAILQASIEYLRYLENCVSDLKAQTQSPRSQVPPPKFSQSALEEDEDEDEDEEMEDEEEPTASTPVTTTQERSGSMVSLPSLSQITSNTTSPSVFSTGRHYSTSSASQASYSPYFHSAHTSPAFGPQLAHVSAMPKSAGPYRETFGIGSPALKPLDSAHQLRHIAGSASELSERRRPASAKTGRSEQELDEEATAALLMLNHDRRSWQKSQHNYEPGRTGTGMSVRDLLSG